MAEFVTIRNKKDKDLVWTGPAESAQVFIDNGGWEKAPKGDQPADPSHPDPAPVADDK